MEEFVIAVLEFVFELIIDISVNWPVAEADPTNRRDLHLSAFWQCALYAMIGALLGLVSVQFLPHACIKNSQLQLLNLILAPCFAAFVAYCFAKRRVLTAMSASQSLRAWKSYCLTLALVLVRYTLVKPA